MKILRIGPTKVGDNNVCRGSRAPIAKHPLDGRLYYDRTDSLPSVVNSDDEIIKFNELISHKFIIPIPLASASYTAGCRGLVN